MLRQWARPFWWAWMLLVLAVPASGQVSYPIPSTGIPPTASALVCFNAGANAYQPCSAANPLQTTPAGGGLAADVNVSKWGGVLTTLGQKTMANSLPMTLASDQPSLPVTVSFPGLQNVNVTQWGSVATSLGQKVMASSVPVTMASDQTALLTQTLPSYQATDIGINWFQATGWTPNNVDVVFANDYTVVSVGGVGTSKISLDRGHTFTVAGGALTGLNHVLGMASSQGVILAAGQTTGSANVTVWRSINSGLSWTPIVLGATGGPVGVTCSPGLALSGSTAIIHTNIGDFRSTNHGASWGAALNATNQCNTAFIFNGNSINLTGTTWLSSLMQGSVWLSTDDGQTWSNPLTPGGSTSARVASSTPTTAWAIADADTNLYRSTDSGATWASVLSFPSILKAVQFVNSKVGIVFVAGTQIWRTIDGGTTWAPANTTFFATGCAGTGCTIPTAANSLGDVELAQSLGGGVEQITYSPVLLSYQVQIASQNGTPLGTATNPIRTDPTNTTTTTVGGTVTANQGTANSAANRWPVYQTDGTNSPAIKAASTSPALTDPAMVTATSPNPAPVCTSFVAINQGTPTKLITGTGSQYLYVCSIVVISASAQSISVVEGTGSVCAAGQTAIFGATTASGALAANGGFAAVAGTPWLRTGTTGDDLCLFQSGAGNISGVITYVSHP